MDGTLVDSYKTIFNSMKLTLDNLDIEYSVDETEFKERIGQHFNEIFNAFNITVPDFDAYLKIYKQIYLEQMRSSVLYPGVKEVLIEIKNRNAKISLLTTKAQDQAEKIIDYFELRKYFDVVMGRQDGIAHKPSPEPLLKICETLNVDIKNTVIVGDTELDIQCGKNAGSFTCAVTYGYRSKELIENEQPNFTVDRVEDILSLDIK